jgi:Concanavalin A-like lectin/glucanases superfamily
MLRGQTQPPLGAVLDLASPYAHGLVARWIWHGSVRAPQDMTLHRGDLISTGTPGPQRASGPAGLAAQWDGTANRYYAVATGDSALLAALNAAPERVTFLAWVRRSVAGVTHPLFSSVAGPATQRYYFGVGSPAGSNLDKLCFALPSSGGGGVGVVGTTSLVAARDYQLVATRNGTSGTNVAFYLNGVPDGTASLAGSPTDTGQKSLGQDPRLPSYFNGLIYHMAVYNRVLSPAEVAYLYAHPFADLRTPTRPLAAVAGTGITSIPLAGHRGRLAGRGGMAA